MSCHLTTNAGTTLCQGSRHAHPEGNASPLRTACDKCTASCSQFGVAKERRDPQHVSPQATFHLHAAVRTAE